MDDARRGPGTIGPSLLPAGLVTFLFTDIGGSTRLLQRWGDDWSGLLDRHRELLRTAFAAHGGVEVRTEGDSFFVAFPDPVEALLATAEGQDALAAERWPEDGVIRVRAGLHTGYAVPQGHDYVALAVHQAARVSEAAYPGQSLVTEETARAAAGRLRPDLALVDLGTHRLKDFDVPQSLFELRGPGQTSDFPPLETTWRGETNLPLPRTSFVGRQLDVNRVSELFDHTRLVTVTGVGGAGKTRLAVQAAAALLDGSGDGVWLTELAAVSDPEMVAPAVASAVGVPEERGRHVVDSLVDALRPKRLMLVIDNCEHLIDACAELVDTVIKACPDVHVLATSRQRLNVDGEHVYRLSPLGVPPDDSGMTIEEALDFEAVQLFVERARAHQPGFAVDANTVAAVTSVCRRVEGLPLAIELAAARLRSLSVGQIDARLDDQFRLLTGGHRSALPRQQGLRAMVDWSYELLDEAERRVLATLSVFSGGWTLDAAEAVAAGDIDVLDVVSSLVDKSLVQAESSGSEVRYGMLESVRQYAAERLADHPEIDLFTVRRRHRDHYLALAERARRGMDTPAQRQWLDRLDLENGNLRAAFAFSLDDPDGSPAALQMCAALARYWVMRGRAVEGMQHAESALGRPAAAATDRDRAAALVALASLNSRSGDFTRARALLEDALAIRRELDDPIGRAEALNDLAWLATRQEDYETARALGEEALALVEAGDNVHLLGRVHATLGDLIERSDLLAGRAHFDEARRHFDAVGDRGASARVLNNLGLIDLSRGDLAASRRALEECLATFSELQDAAALPTVLSNLGLIAIEESEFERAQELFARGLTLGHRTRDKELMVYTVLGLAMAAGGLGDSDRGAVLHGAVDTLAADLGMALDHLEATLRDRSIAELRRVLGDETFDRKTAEGRTLGIDDAVSYALAVGVPAGVTGRMP